MSGSVRKRKKADDISLTEKLTLCCRAGAQKAGGILFSLSIHSYFLWSTLLFLVCGVALIISHSQVQERFCAKPAQVELGGPGCKNCSSELLTCSKSLCYRTAVNITWQAEARSSDLNLYQSFIDASTDVACNDLFRSKATDPVQMIVAIAAKIATDPRALTAGCTDFHCGILSNAMGDFSDLDSSSGTCTNKFGTKSSSDATLCPCKGLVTSPATFQAFAQISSLCGSFLTQKCPWGTSRPGWCATTTSINATTANTTTARPTTQAGVVRRLGDASWEEPVPQWLSLPDKATRIEDGIAELGSVGSGVTHNRLGCNSSSNSRKLQTAPTPAPTPSSLNDNLEPYTVGVWSMCQCYQQCVPGVRTRSVKCLATSCKEPIPKTKEPCECSFCAACEAILPMFVLSLLFFSQAGLAGICFLCYLHAATVKEEVFIKISCSEKIGGFFSKNLPPLVRLLVLSNLVLLCLILTYTFVPKLFTLDWNPDCYQSSELRLACIIVASIWIVQVLLGRCAKRIARKPPWLLVPDRANWPTPIKQIMQFFRGLGP